MGVTSQPSASEELRWLEVARGMVVLGGSLVPEQVNGTLRLMPGTLRIGYVRRGGCAVTVPEGMRARIGEGDVAIVSASVGFMGVELRGGRADGLVLSVDSGRLPTSVRRVFAGLEVNLESIERKVPPERPLLVSRAAPELARVLEETFPLLCEGDVGHVRLKAVEILRGLSTSADDSGPDGADRGLASTRARHACLAIRAQQELMRDVSVPKTISTLAVLCGTSPTVLKEAFKETFGIPLHAWYREYRIRMAARSLLEGGDTIAGVAASVGYSNPSKFAKAFFDVMGTTPREWRAAHSAGGAGARRRNSGAR